MAVAAARLLKLARNLARQGLSPWEVAPGTKFRRPAAFLAADRTALEQSARLPPQLPNITLEEVETFYNRARNASGPINLEVDDIHAWARYHGHGLLGTLRLLDAIRSGAVKKVRTFHGGFLGKDISKLHQRTKGRFGKAGFLPREMPKPASPPLVFTSIRPTSAVERATSSYLGKPLFKAWAKVKNPVLMLDSGGEHNPMRIAIDIERMYPVRLKGLSDEVDAIYTAHNGSRVEAGRALVARLRKEGYDSILGINTVEARGSAFMVLFEKDQMKRLKMTHAQLAALLGMPFAATGLAGGAAAGGVAPDDAAQ